MNDEQSVLQFIQLFLDSNSPDPNIRTEAENNISKLKSTPLDFLIGVNKLLDYDKVPIEAVRMSLIITKQLIANDSEEKLNNMRRVFNSCQDYSEVLKSILSHVFTSNDQIVQNLLATIYAYFFNIEREKWLEGLDWVFSNFKDNDDPNSKTFFLNIINDILNCDVLPLFQSEEKQQQLQEIFRYSISIIKTAESIPIDLRISASQYVLKSFQFLHFNLLPKDDYQSLCQEILESLPSSFQIANLQLFQNITSVMLNLIEFGYLYISPFLDTIIQFSFNSFEIPNPAYWEIVFDFWRQILFYEYKVVKKSHRIKLSQTIAPKLLQFCQTAINRSNLDNLFNSDFPDYSIITAARKTIRAYYHIFPQFVFELINQNFESIAERNIYTAVSFFYSMANQSTFHDDFLKFALEKSGQLFAFANDQNIHISIRILSLKTLGKLLRTFKYYAQNSLIVDSRQQLSQYFLLIGGEYAIQNKSTILRPNEHPLVIQAFLDLILKLVDAQRQFLFTPNQIHFFHTNLIQLLTYVLALYESNYKHFDQQLVVSSTKAMRSLIFIANDTVENVHLFLCNFFDYCQKHLTTSNSLFESPEVRFTFQNSLCDLLVALGRKMATNNEICHKSFEALLQFVTNPQQLVFEEAMLAISAFIKQIATLIDPEVIKKLYLTAMETLTITSEQKIISGASLIQSLLEKQFITFLVEEKQQVVLEIYHLLQTSIKDNPLLKNSHCYVLYAIASLFQYVDNDLLVPLKEEFWGFLQFSIEVINDVDVKAENIDDDDDFETAAIFNYLNSYYQEWCHCLTQYVNSFIETPKNPFVKEINQEHVMKNVLDLLNKLGYKLMQIGYENINVGLYRMYINLVGTITSKCTRSHNSLLNKIIIKKPIVKAIEAFQDTKSKKVAEALLNQMDSL